MSSADRLVLVVGECAGCADRYKHLLQADEATSYHCLEAIADLVAPEIFNGDRSLDGILLDAPLTRIDFLDLLQQVQRGWGEQAPPVVMVGEEDTGTAVAALKAGVADYLVREQLTSETLCVSLRTAIENAELKRQLQQREQQFRISVENMLDCFGIYTAIRDETGQIVDFRIDYINQAACQNNCMTRAEQLGQRLCEVLPEHRESGLFDEYCQLVETGVPVVKESLVYDGHFKDQRIVRAFDIRASKLNDGFVASWRDVTDRKQLELELSQSSAHLRRIIETAPIGIAIGKANGEVRVINDAMLALHGYTREAFERQGMNWHDFTPPEYGDRIAPAMTQLQQQGILPPEEKELLRPDGTRVPVWISATQSADRPDEHVAFVVDLSAQKQAEAALQASQQHYQTLAEAMPQMVWEADATGAVNYWNQRWYEYTGLTPAASFGLEGVEAIHPEERDRTLTRWQQAIAQGQSFEVEHRIRRQDGTYRWFINRGIPTYDAAGRLTGWIGTITDLDDQKRLEEGLRLVVRAADSLIYDWDLPTHTVRQSEKLVDIVGFHPDEVPDTADWWNHRIHPDDQPRLQQQLKGLMGGDHSLFETEYRVRHRDGHWVDVWDRSCVVRNEQGQVIRIVGSTLDVSEQKAALRDRERAEVALRQSQERLHLAMQAAGIGIWDLNLRTQQVQWSDNLLAMFDLEPEDFDGQIETVMAMIHPEERSQVAQRLQEAVDTGAEYQLEFRFVRPNGTVRWALSMGRVFYDDAGIPLTMTGIDMDITDRKQAELALKAAKIQLESALIAGAVYTWRWDLPANLVTVSRHFAHLFGIDTDAAIPQLPIEHFLTAIHPDDRTAVTTAIDSAIANHDSYAVEFRVTDIAGEEHWVFARGQVEYDRNGIAIAFPGALADITERKQMEADLQRQMQEAEAGQQILEALMAYIPEGVTIADAPDVSIRMVSRYGQQLIARSMESLVDLPSDRHLEAWKIFHLDGETPATPEALPLTRAVQQGEIVTNEEWILQHPERPQPIFISCNAGPIRNTRGDITGGIITWRDIGDLKQKEWERQQAQRELAANEARLRGFVEANVVGILYGDIYGQVTEANDEFLRMIGYTRAELAQGQINWEQLTPPEYLPLDEQAIAEARERGACTPYEKEYWRKDGSRVPVLLGYSLLGEAREESVVFVLDVSDRQQAELALRESEDRLRLSLESAQLGTWDWNLVTDELIWDAGCKAMFGLPADADSSIEVFFAGLHPDDRDRLRQIVSHSLDPSSGGIYDTEFRTIGLQDQEERWIKAAGQVYFNPDGQPLRFIGVVLDITQRKQLEARRAQILQQEQAAREAAERANRIKDEFLAILSHELRSPLNPILGWANLLRTKSLSPEVTARALETIERNAKLQTQLIDDLLDVARILRGKLRLEMTTVDPAFVVEAAIETVQSAADAKAIAMHTDLADVGPVHGDEGRLQQIVWNLLTNAVKFTPEQGRIEVRLTQVNRAAQIQVTDTGMGIHADFLPHIFESFRQEDTSVTRRFGGLGLGLAIVRYLVEAHGGNITADSPGEGQGATFTVRLPLLVAHPFPLSPAPAPPTTDLQGKRVLVVDDSPDTLEILTVSLEQYGAVVKACSTAGAAFAHLIHRSPDILICDIGMPEMDGYTLLQQIRSLSPEQGGQIPAIALTAYARDEERQKALNHGFQRHIAKPFDPGQLATAIAELCRNPSGT